MCENLTRATAPFSIGPFSIYRVLCGLQGQAFGQFHGFGQVQIGFVPVFFEDAYRVVAADFASANNPALIICFSLLYPSIGLQIRRSRVLYSLLII